MPEDNRTPHYHHRPGAGPTLVFLHYWGGSSGTWTPVIDRLDGRATLTIDARGWGRSRDLPGPYSLDQMARDVGRVVAEAGLTRFVLVGHSMGGKVAQLAAAAHPDGLTGLVLVGSGPAKPAAVVTPDYQRQLSHAYDSAESIAGVRDHVLTATVLTDEVKAQIVADSLSAGAEARAEWPRRGIAEDITAAARAIDVPVLVIAGEHDAVEPAGVLRTNLLPYLARAEFTVIADTGHLLPLEAPDELARAITAFADTHKE
ncbi:alpha/beta fold hydrolase [Actinoplanes sp. L3-i22]|uniref:alpha/beta fold hydrolase n=1 Tax=Actinoplanes sp. L3-i22 TaxID=2836373 RepID=UPI001C7447D0|nr:alpha/beta hydrolase [Actinoplanes sp. L3-i22]BCY08936.1 hydrolase [Actinoplanes sp. L3-i22]